MYAHQVSAKSVQKHSFFFKKGLISRTSLLRLPPLPSFSQIDAPGVLDELGKGEYSVTCMKFMRKGA